EKVSPASKIEPTKITLITAVKVTRTSEYNDPDVYYNYKGYKNYNLENNRLVKDDTTEEVSTSSDEDSMNDLHDELTSCKSFIESSSLDVDTSSVVSKIR